MSNAPFDYPVGGLRYRLINDSLYQMLKSSLDELGWFSSPSFCKSPVTFIPEEQDRDVEIKANLIALADTSVKDTDFELGSSLGEMRWTFYADVYAESKSVGIHISNDIRDILKGRFPALGRDNPIIVVYDYELATPVEIFTCDIEDVLLDKGRSMSKNWLRHWYTVRFDIVDYYGD